LNNKCGEIGPRQGAKRSKAEALRAFETPCRADFHHIYSTNLQFRTLAKHTKVSDATQAAGYGTGAGVIGAPGVVGATGCTLPPHPAVEIKGAGDRALGSTTASQEAGRQRDAGAIFMSSQVVSL
jgi:hypothetical protein